MRRNADMARNLHKVLASKRRYFNFDECVILLQDLSHVF